MNQPQQSSDLTVCVLEPIHEDALAMLGEHARLLTPETGAIERWQQEADAIIVRARQVTRGEIENAQKLKVIGKHGAGTDSIAIDAAQEKDIAVVSTPGINAASVADLALAMALSLSRNLSGHTDALRAGTPLTGRQRIGFEMAELPAGIIGLGAIGKAVAARLQGGFGVSVAAFDPGIAAADWPADIQRMESVDALLRQTRLLFLHVGLNDATRNMIDSPQLALLPADSFVINCARGGVVNENALAEALTSGRIAGAASDVFEQEPPAPDHPLLQHSGFIATPHIGGSTEAGLRRTGEEVVRRVLAALNN